MNTVGIKKVLDVNRILLGCFLVNKYFYDFYYFIWLKLELLEKCLMALYSYA